MVRDLDAAQHASDGDGILVGLIALNLDTLPAMTLGGSGRLQRGRPRDWALQGDCIASIDEGRTVRQIDPKNISLVVEPD